jgi:hypothetical protein
MSEVFPSPAFHQIVKASSTPTSEKTMLYCAMADDARIRTENLRALWDARGFTVTSAPKVLGRSASFWSDLRKGNKSFGEKLARDIEERLQLPRGWLDQAHDTNNGLSTSPAPPPRDFADPRFVDDEEFEIVRDFRDLADGDRDRFKASLRQMADAYRIYRDGVISDLRAKGKLKEET